MRIETRRRIAEDEWQSLTQWNEIVFPVEGRDKEWSPLSWHSVAYSELGSPIAHLGFDRFEIMIDSNSCSVIGLGGLVVLPRYQGQGIPALLRKEARDLAAKMFQVDIFTFFCPKRLVPLYKRLGYIQHKGAVYFMQHGEKVQSSFEFMHSGNLDTESLIELECQPW